MAGPLHRTVQLYGVVGLSLVVLKRLLVKRTGSRGNLPLAGGTGLVGRASAGRANTAVSPGPPFMGQRGGRLAIYWRVPKSQTHMRRESIRGACEQRESHTGKIAVVLGPHTRICRGRLGPPIARPRKRRRLLADVGSWSSSTVAGVRVVTRRVAYRVKMTPGAGAWQKVTPGRRTLEIATPSTYLLVQCCCVLLEGGSTMKTPATS